MQTGTLLLLFFIKCYSCVEIQENELGGALVTCRGGGGGGDFLTVFVGKKLKKKKKLEEIKEDGKIA
jgi:hypothetical protein